MNDFDTIRVATAYEIGGRTASEFPYEITGDLRPVYTSSRAGNATCAGTAATRVPRGVQTHVEFIERQTGVPVKIISVGPDRGETIVR